MDRHSLFLFHLIPDIGPVRLRALLEIFETPERILAASKAKLVEAGLSEAFAHRVLGWGDRRRMAEEELALAEAEGVAVLTWLDEDYPPLLKTLPDAPIALYCLGDPESLSRHSIAIVGSRRCTPYGEKLARRFAEDFAAVDIPVVSGLARGIDTAAHQGALAADGQTVAVLGSGLLEIYPPENRKLARFIAAQGAVVSEFPLRMRADTGHFPRRNRLIAGLSLGTVVVEADERSGALITGRLAAEQGREVFAVPGPVSSKVSRGPHRLIRQGAKLAERAQDVLEELPLLKERIEILTASQPQDPASALSAAESRLLACLGPEPVGIDRLAAHSELSSGDFSKVLLDLEIKGAIYSLPGKRYART